MFCFVSSQSVLSPPFPDSRYVENFPVPESAVPKPKLLIWDATPRPAGERHTCARGAGPLAARLGQDGNEPAGAPGPLGLVCPPPPADARNRTSLRPARPRGRILQSLGRGHEVLRSENEHFCVAHGFRPSLGAWSCQRSSDPGLLRRRGPSGAERVALSCPSSSVQRRVRTDHRITL